MKITGGHQQGFMGKKLGDGQALGRRHVEMILVPMALKR